MRIANMGCLALLGAVVMAAPVQAGVSDAFGNTIISHYPRGEWVKHYFEPDGTYSAAWSDGRRLSGRWVIEGQKVCLIELRPRQLISRFCTPMVQASVGDTWPSRDPLGRSVRNELVAGRR
ncbi:hypothetical protein [Brevundimonas nasdae]|uniref:hypothetical protein n=1 Tax=Brevundimonas nasdae TaxID=172043 RepID=UPI0028A06921|nr:hypothetical protein [Brevundimonas nasdae]